MKICQVWYKYKDKEYRVVDFPHTWDYYRDKVRWRKVEDVQRTCGRLNFIAASDEFYEIREVIGPLDF